MIKPMRSPARSTVLMVAWFATTLIPRGAASTELARLYADPLCEASAALVAPWDEDLVLVADNEIYDQLFGFTLEDTGLEPAGVLSMPRKDRPRDIEALAKVGTSVLVVGSHSRSNACRVRSKRLRLRWC